jgi:hypothetical protein
VPENTKLEPLAVQLVAFKCYDTYIQYKGAAGSPDFSLYIARESLPSGLYPYRIHLTLESAPDTHWKPFAPQTFV